MSVRLLLGVLATLVAAFVSLPTSIATADEPGEPCFGGLVSVADEAGLLEGSECADVLLASAETTSIDGGEGYDLIIGAENVVLIEGGNGADYILADGVGAILMGGEGDDLIDAGGPPAGGGLGESAADQIGLATDLLSNGERQAFLGAVQSALALARDPDRVDLDEELRDDAIRSNKLVRQVLDPDDAVIDGEDEEQVAEIEASRAEAEAYADAMKGFVQREAGGEAGGSGSPMATMGLGDELEGNGDKNWIYGGRGNDTIYGRGNQDQLYGGVGDDTIFGGQGHDYLLGGMGADKLDGQLGNDVAQGDATTDKMKDSGGSTGDVLSYASGGAPGFPGSSMSAYPNFPSGSGERGVYVDLAAGKGNNGSLVEAGGGRDMSAATWEEGTRFGDFEHVVGTAFADVIKGDAGANVLQGGGGSDVIVGKGGQDTLFGEAGGDNLKAAAGSWIIGGQGDDYCAGSTVLVQCEPSMASNWVGSRDTGSISVGMTTQSYAGNVKSQLYLSGSTADWVGEFGRDIVTVTQLANPGHPPIFEFSSSAAPGQGQFSLAPEDQTPGCSYTATLVTCTPATNAVTLVLAGFGQDDNLNLVNVGQLTSTVFVGGSGSDNLSGGNYTEDFMHGGTGGDILAGKAGSDGLMNTEGSDENYGGDGNDLIVSSVVCDDDWLGGGGGKDSASWAQLKGADDPGTVHGMFASISTGYAGRNVGGSRDCSGIGPSGQFGKIEDLEGSKHNDALYGGPGINSLLGRATTDRLQGFGGADTIRANADDVDYIFCGAGAPDKAIVDFKWPNGTERDQFNPVNCETIKHKPPIYGE